MHNYNDLIHILLLLVANILQALLSKLFRFVNTHVERLPLCAPAIYTTKNLIGITLKST